MCERTIRSPLTHSSCRTTLHTIALHRWSHQCLCSTYKLYTNRRKQLSTFPLGDWHQLLTSRRFQLSEDPYEDYLYESLGNLDGSWWSTELHGWKGGESKSAQSIDFSYRKTYSEGFCPVTDIPLEQPVIHSERFPWNEFGLRRLSSWRDYYELREIPESSIVALLLTFPMTLYYAIAEYGSVPCTVAKMLSRPLRIHIVGAEKELNFLDLFKEVSFLAAPDFSVELVFVVRPDMVPQRSTDQSLDLSLTDTLRVSVVSGTYGDSLDPQFDCGSGPPDMIVAFDAGLFAYESWRSVVEYLDVHCGVVGVFTDYNEFSGVACAGISGDCSSLCVNPFRQPRAMPREFSTLSSSNMI